MFTIRNLLSLIIADGHTSQKQEASDKSRFVESGAPRCISTAVDDASPALLSRVAESRSLGKRSHGLNRANDNFPAEAAITGRVSKTAVNPDKLIWHYLLDSSDKRVIIAKVCSMMACISAGNSQSGQRWPVADYVGVLVLEPVRR